VAAVRARIAEACRRAGRPPDEVRLVAATKTIPVEAIRRAASAGVDEFGENYVQELVVKRDAVPGVKWHFLGRLQRNKIGRVLAAADVVQTLEPGSAATRLVARAAERESPLACLVEVDFTGRRVGVQPERVTAFCEEVVTGPGVEVVGLMTVPPLDVEPRPYFARLRALRDRVSATVPGVRHLSMGMSADFEEAIAEGATMVRVGQAIFGPRP
jgi:pyridoxal phosphate enzyme (YggS family)